MKEQRSESARQTKSSIRTIDPASLRALLGPAEAQYEQIALSMEGAQGPIACGSTVVDGSADDFHGGAGASVNFLWTDPSGVETGSRFQLDVGSATFVNDDSGFEWPPATNEFEQQLLGAPGSVTFTARVMAHVGHAPGHGTTPIAGDVLSNTCTVTLVIPDVG